MFDLATRPQPVTTDPAAVFGVPFDLRLVPPLPAGSYAWTDLVNDTGAPQPAVEVLATYAVELEDTLATAVTLSLFTDRRAGRDDRLPRGVSDRRGWLGESYFQAATPGQRAAADAWGSGLWLVYATKTMPDVLEQARFAAEEALAWLVRDGIADRVTVTAQWVGPRQDRLAVRPTIYQASQGAPVYDVLWGTSITRWASEG